MKSEFFNQFLNQVEQLGHAITRWTRRAVYTVREMNGAQLAATAVGLALALTILPLALVLFVFFMLVKIVITAFILSKRRKALPPPTTLES